MVALVAVNAGMFPLPLAAKPMLVVLFVQLYVVPATGLVKFTGAVNEPLQTVWFGTGLTVGVGATVIVKVIGVPTQLTTLV